MICRKDFTKQLAYESSARDRSRPVFDPTLGDFTGKGGTKHIPDSFKQNKEKHSFIQPEETYANIIV